MERLDTDTEGARYVLWRSNTGGGWVDMGCEEAGYGY